MSTLTLNLAGFARFARFALKTECNSPISLITKLDQIKNVFESNVTSTFNDIIRKLYVVRTHSTVEKRAKRMPDTTVQTTHGHHSKSRHPTPTPTISESSMLMFVGNNSYFKAAKNLTIPRHFKPFGTSLFRNNIVWLPMPSLDVISTKGLFIYYVTPLGEREG